MRKKDSIPCPTHPLTHLLTRLSHSLCRGASRAFGASSTFFLTCFSRFSQSIQLAAHFSSARFFRALSQESSSAFSSRRAPFRSLHFRYASIRFNRFSG